MSEEQLNSTDDPCAHPVCESCGEPFGCGAGSLGCWCVEVKLTDEVRARLRERFKNCLCRACLERYAAGEGLSETEKSFLVEKG